MLFPFTTLVIGILDGSFLFSILFAISLLCGVLAFVGYKLLERKRGLFFTLKVAIVFLTFWLFATAIFWISWNTTLNIIIGFVVINMQFVGFTGALLFPRVILADIIDIGILELNIGRKEGLFMGVGKNKKNESFLTNITSFFKDYFVGQVMQVISLMSISGLFQVMGDSNPQAILLMYFIAALFSLSSAFFFFKVKLSSTLDPLSSSKLPNARLNYEELLTSRRANEEIDSS